MMVDNYIDSQRQAEKLSEILQKAIDMETEQHKSKNTRRVQT